MAYYNYLLGKVIYEENLPADYNAAQIAAMQAAAQIQPQPTDDSGAIAGTRTSSVRFTRSSGTWTTDALIGQFVWSHASGSPETGKFLKVSANGTNTLNVDPAYGAGELEATGTAILLLSATSEVEAMKQLEALSTWVKTA